ncbi:Uncharacterised protein [Legionella pneumophila]|nr:hypothetical protein ULM_20790 [Legionella pneumophila]CZH17093.1 Uncharacterised protein [Legionella pneumophila]CZH20404.1 Uncharacterised protein [Legionella pneumophila]CZH32136.1 Uncharacterised protein [Legionella pneumophila]CZH42528.1 Uncharacterised protein [Legionella pneumophila]
MKSKRIEKITTPGHIVPFYDIFSIKLRLFYTKTIIGSPVGQYSQLKITIVICCADYGKRNKLLILPDV